MMPKTVSLLPKDGKVHKISKIECTSIDSSCTQPLKNGKGSSHSTIVIPTGSKMYRCEIGTGMNVERTTSMPSVGYLLSWLLACVVFLVVVIFWLQSSSLSRQMQMLKDDMAKINQEMSLITANYHAQKLLVEEVSQRFDESAKEHRHLKYLVKRETRTSTGYDSIEDLSDEDNVGDSAEPLIEKSSFSVGEEKPHQQITENVNISANVFQEVDTGIMLKANDVISETNTEPFFNDSQTADFSAHQRSARSKRSNGRGNKETQKRKQSLRGPNIKNNTNKRRNANRKSKSNKILCL